jgi:hypothetical protein
MHARHARDVQKRNNCEAKSLTVGEDPAPVGEGQQHPPITVIHSTKYGLGLLLSGKICTYTMVVGESVPKMLLASSTLARGYHQ